MKPAPESDDFLDDVLAESAPVGFRDALLGETLRLARRRRWGRHAGRVALAATVACAAGIIVWQSAPRGVMTVSSVAQCEIVRTQPLAADAIVSTGPLDPERVVVSVASVRVTSTKSGADIFRVIDDDELLALAAPRLAALVRVGPRSQTLVFVAPEEQVDPPPN